jgi:hypothetical protein
MQRSEASVVSSPPEPAVDNASVREQLDRILSSPLFRNSKRYPSLLRYVVEQALDGHGSDLKERTLGIEVFGRSPDYDTNVDPVVRISAAEIRKRIAQYYHEAGHESEVRIDLPLGSYVPEFRLAVERLAPEKTAVPAVPTLMPAPVPAAVPEAQPAVLAAPSPVPPAAVTDLRKVIGFVLLSAILTGGLVWLKPWVRPTALDEFWAPMLNRGAILLCIGRNHDSEGRPHGVALTDAITLARLTGVLSAKGQSWTIRAEDQATFGDLRQGPAVLIGAFNDSWNLRLANSMRFTLHQSGPVDWIEDPQNPASRAWSITVPQPGGPRLSKDFALITRVIDPNTDRIMVAVGGLWGYGTLAAGEFLSDPKYMEAFGRQAQPGWQKKNLQIVLSTEVIMANSGPPRVVASYSW